LVPKVFDSGILAVFPDIVKDEIKAIICGKYLI
jgi:hypothetical protein